MMKGDEDLEIVRRMIRRPRSDHRRALERYCTELTVTGPWEMVRTAHEELTMVHRDSRAHLKVALGRKSPGVKEVRRLIQKIEDDAHGRQEEEEPNEG